MASSPKSWQIVKKDKSRLGSEVMGERAGNGCLMKLVTNEEW